MYASGRSSNADMPKYFYPPVRTSFGSSPMVKTFAKFYDYCDTKRTAKIKAIP